MTGFAAQPDPLYRSGQRYQDVHDRLTTLYARLTSDLDAAGQFWGDDATGQDFAHKYCPGAIAQLEQMSGTAEGLQSIIDGVAGWARNYVNADSAVARNTPSAG